jgi:hypothetical protein
LRQVGRLQQQQQQFLQKRVSRCWHLDLCSFIDLEILDPIYYR